MKSNNLTLTVADFVEQGKLNFESFTNVEKGFITEAQFYEKYSKGFNVLTKAQLNDLSKGQNNELEKGGESMTKSKHERVVVLLTDGGFSEVFVQSKSSSKIEKGGVGSGRHKTGLHLLKKPGDYHITKNNGYVVKTTKGTLHYNGDSNIDDEEIAHIVHENIHEHSEGKFDHEKVKEYLKEMSTAGGGTITAHNDNKDVKKGGENDIEKAILNTYDNKFTFKKSGKDIKEKLTSIKNILSDKVTQSASAASVLLSNLGDDFKPTRTVGDWEYGAYSRDKIGEYLLFEYDLCYHREDHGSVNTGTTKESAACCDKYNDLVYKIISYKRDICECDTFINNLEDGTSYTLSAEQLVKLGF